VKSPGKDPLVRSLGTWLFVIWRLIRKDLANRDRFEAALVGREKRIRRLIDSNVVGVVFSDPDGIVEANDEFLSMVGIDRALWRPRAHRLFAFTAPEFRALDEKCAAELRGTGTSRPFQKELLRPDGSRVPVLFGVAAVETDAEKPLWTSFVVDLTEMKRLESERNRLYEEARDAVKARDAFLSVAGHEIRTPLSALNLQLFQLSRHLLVLGNERALALARRSDKQVARLVRLSDRLLDVSRITAGALHLDLEEVDLALLVREIADRFEDSAGRAGCVLTVRAPESLVGFWDRSRLDQVITNLLSNALKFGAGKPVDLGLRLAGEAALLTVNDMGIGIHADDQARIFERFERAVAREAYRGMGLGLWIVREIVSAHDGKLTVQSRPGAGATFTVTFPRRMGTEEAVE
jgi:PAS domain S-box-containing protein